MLGILQTFAQTYNYSYSYTTTNSHVSGGAIAGFLITMLLIFLVVFVFFAICMAKIFTKAGRKWWEAIIPIYSTYVLLQIVGRPGWWLLLYFIPFVNFIISIIVYIDLAKAFGKDVLVGILLLLVPIIMLPIFAFGKSFQYVGASAAGQGPMSPGAAGPTPPPQYGSGAPTAPVQTFVPTTAGQPVYPMPTPPTGQPPANGPTPLPPNPIR